MEHELQLLLPRGILTYGSYDGVNTSTIHHLFASENLTDLLIQCGISTTEHRSDHRPIQCLFEARVDENQATLGGQLYEKADWDEIQRRFLECMPPLQTCQTKPDLEEYSTKLLDSIIQCLENIPRASLSPYAKRW